MVYNIGSGDERTNLEDARVVCETVGASDDLIEFVEDRFGHDQRYALDASQVREFGWGPQVPFEDRLCRTVNHYQ